MAKKLVDRRQSEGPFICRSQLMSVAGLGPKTYEQCAGFLRIMPQCNSHHSERFVCLSVCSSCHILSYAMVTCEIKLF